MKKAILVITLTLVVLVIAGFTIGCTPKTTIAVPPIEIVTPATTYAVTLGTITTVTDDTTSTITVPATPPAAGTTVTLTIVPKTGMRLKADTLVATYNGGTVATLSGASPYTFTMPAYAVEVTAEFEAIPPTSTTKTTQMTFPTMDLTGTWSGTHIITSSAPNMYNDKQKYHLVVTIKGQYIENQILGQFTATGISYYRDGILQPSCGAYAWPRMGEISGTTVTWRTMGDDKTPGERLQVSGNSMTGKGGYTDTYGTTYNWEYNLTRVH